MRRSSSVVSVLLSLLLVACPKDEKPEDHGAPPPEAPAAKAGACASGGGQVGDPISTPFFPRVVASYCLDPQGETRTFGEKGKLDMSEVCTTALDGECEVYKQFGMKRLVALRYVDGSGGAGTVEIYLSQYGDKGGAYGMFTKRVIADSDPADPSAPKPLEVGGAGAIGTGRAYVWRGVHLAELQYNNDQESPEQLATSSAKILGALAKDVGAKLPGGSDKPDAAARLPTENLVANGIQFVPTDPWGQKGVGAAAIGYYKDGTKRYRLVSIVRDDVDQAKDAMKTLRARPGSLPISGLGEEATVVALGDAKTEYVFARRGVAILGATDEELGGAGRLSRDERIARVRSWLAAPAPTNGK